MPTQKPLAQLVPDILKNINSKHQNQTVFEKNLLEVWEGGLQKHVEKAISNEFDGGAAHQSKQRVSPINILPKVISKMSQVYTNGVSRSVSKDDTGNRNEQDTDLMAFYEKSMGMDTKLSTANKMANLFQYCAIEPYLDSKGQPTLRVIPPTMFSIFSDDPADPLTPTVFIKFMGKETDFTGPRTTTAGAKVKDAQTEVTDPNIYFLYSDQEFIVIDETGSVRNDIMAAVGNPEGENPAGRIPFTYINTAEFQLQPYPKQDMYTMPVLIPRLLTDLNFAAKFQSYAILYSIDLDVKDIESGPASMWALQSSDQEKSGSIGTIKPEVDVDKVLTLINSQLTLWLETLGIKSSGMGSVTASSAASGIAKAIDEADSTALTSEQKKVFRSVEQDLWALIQTLHRLWTAQGRFDGSNMSGLFSEDFEPTVVFEELQVLVDPMARLTELKVKLDNGWTSRRRALAEANMDLNPAEIEELMTEIDEEAANRASRALEIFKEGPDTLETDDKDVSDDD